MHKYPSEDTITNGIGMMMTIMITITKHLIIGVLCNANYHFNNALNLPLPWDFYAGLNVRFYSWNSPKEYKGSHNSG